MLRRRMMFENDVKMYGTQATANQKPPTKSFENDVKMYGTQANTESIELVITFENDVKMYGTQAVRCQPYMPQGLRMM